MKRLLFIAVCLLWVVHVRADHVTATEARQKAARFLQGQTPVGGKHRAARAAAQLTLAETGRDDSYYVFNAADSAGYVIVSGEDCTDEILGYADSGTIDADNIPCGMRVLLDGYSGQIENIRSGVTSVRAKARRTAFHVDEGRLARFGQYAPYYDKCPTYWTGNLIMLSDPFCTGCAATAMAQLMYAYQWPQAIYNPISPYTSVTRKKDVEGFEAGTKIDWTNIEQRYNDGRKTTKEQREAIADLMLMAGAAVRMDYGKNGVESEASAVSVAYALKQYFGYSPSLTFSRSLYTDSVSWVNRLCSELQKGYPIMYRGQNDAGGRHFFMLEGYDENEYFDVNFGWEGSQSDALNLGHFLLFLDDSQDRSSLLNYHNYQDAFLNVAPRTDGATPDIPVSLWPMEGLGLDGAVYFRSADDKKFHNVEMSWTVLDDMPVDEAVIDCGFAVTRNGEQLGEIVPIGSVVSSFKDQHTISAKCSFGQDMTDGLYQLCFVSKVNGKADWVKADNFDSEFVSCFVCGDALTLRSQVDAAVKLEAYDIKASVAEGQLRVGKVADIDFTVKSVNKDYDGAVLALLYWEDENGVLSYEPLGIYDTHLTAGQTMAVSMAWSPFRAGKQEIRILNKHWDVIGSTSINVVPADAMLDMLEVTKLSIDNWDLYSGSIDGTYLKGSLTMTNHDEVTKKERLNIRLWDNTTADFVGTCPMQVNIDAGDVVSYGFSFTNLKENHTYTLWAIYDSGSDFFKSEPMLCRNEDTGETISGNDELSCYEYWFDDDYAHRTVVKLGDSRATVRASVDTDHLPDGVHRFHFRVLRNDGDYSAVNSTPFLKIGKEKTGHIDYWLDDDYEHVRTVTLEDTENEQVLALDFADEELFPNGHHRLNMQVAMSGTVLGTVHTTPLLKLAAGEPAELEYWFDNDVADSKRLTGKKAASGGDYLYIDDIDMSHLAQGVHRLNLRATSSTGGTPGSLLSTPVVKLASAKADMLEYWFDDDQEHTWQLKGTADGDTYLFDEALDVSHLDLGVHRLNIRATGSDNTNKGALVTSNVLKIASGQPSLLQYWFDGDIANSRILGGHAAEGGESGYIFTDELDLNNVQPGHHRLYYRAIAASGTTTTAVSTASVVLKSRYGGDGEPTLASYALVLDGDSLLDCGPLDATAQAVYSYVLNGRDLSDDVHTLTATFWNSYGVSVTEKAWFRLGDFGIMVPGDVNGSGEVNIVDVTSTISHILGQTPEDFNPEAADVDGNGVVNVVDVTTIIDMILKK